MYNAIYFLGSFKKYIFDSKHWENIFTVSSVLYSPTSGLSSCHCPGYSWVPMCACIHTRALKCKHFRVQRGTDSLLPSVLQVIYCINHAARGKCMESDYTIIHNTISMKHLSRPIHQSLIQ